MKWRKATFLASMAALAGCGDAAGPPGQRELQVTVRAAGSSAPAGAAAQRDAGTTVAIESVTFVLGGLKLETAGLDSTVDWVLDESVVIPLDLTGVPALAFDTDVPPGVYQELELSVDKLEVGNPAEEPLISTWPGLAEASVLVTGTVTPDGGTPQPFTFAAALDIDLELPFDGPVTFTGGADGPILVLLTIDPSGWFIGLAGALDPTDPANRSAIESNIQGSVELQRGDD
jgi:hypothetical protein